jgi:hypothetical protein
MRCVYLDWACNRGEPGLSKSNVLCASASPLREMEGSVFLRHLVWLPYEWVVNHLLRWKSNLQLKRFITRGGEHIVVLQDLLLRYEEVNHLHGHAHGSEAERAISHADRPVDSEELHRLDCACLRWVHLPEGDLLQPAGYRHWQEVQLVWLPLNQTGEEALCRGLIHHIGSNLDLGGPRQDWRVPSLL